MAEIDDEDIFEKRWLSKKNKNKKSTKERCHLELNLNLKSKFKIKGYNKRNSLIF